jgi:hypothetical protein
MPRGLIVVGVDGSENSSKRCAGRSTRRGFVRRRCASRSAQSQCVDPSTATNVAEHHFSFRRDVDRYAPSHRLPEFLPPDVVTEFRRGGGA